MAALTHPVFALSDRFVDDYAARRPMEATYLGIGGHDHEWGDLGLDGVAALEDLLRRTRAELDALPPPEDRWDALAVRVLDGLLHNELEWIETGEHLIDIGHMASTIPGMREVTEVMDTTTADGWRDLTARFETMGDALAGWRQCVDQGRRTGQVVARRQVTSVIEQLRASVASDGSFTRTAAAFAAAGIDDPELGERLAKAMTTVETAVLDTADWLERTYLPDASDRDGVGPERYLRSARRLLGMDLDVDEAYAWAWDHLRELRYRMIELAGQIDPDLDLHGIVALLKSDPARAAQSQDEFRGLMQARQERALAELDGVHFDIPDEIRRVEVRMAPPGAPLSAYYIGPSEDWSRPGTVWWAMGDKQVIPLYEEVSTAYHEGFPGHHMQIGIQMALADRLSRAHRLLAWYPGYGEGWALYTERLMDELGYFEQPDYVFGQLCGSMLRTVRVVVDIGNHLDRPIPDDAPFHPGERWSFELGVQMLQDYAFLDRDYAESEMTRYLGWPAQAISYKLGEREILALRTQVAQRQGNAFDLKAFHARVLGRGPLGLAHLRELVLASD